MKTPKEVDEAKLAIKVMLASGTPISRIRSLLKGDQFTDAEIDSILQSCPGYQARVNELFQHRIASGTACVLGFGAFLYYVIFQFRDWSATYFLPLAIGVWGLFKLYRGPTSDIAITRWGGKQTHAADERKSSIKKYL